MKDDATIPLDFSQAVAPKPAPKAAELAEFLKGKGWLSAEEIHAQTGWNDRRVRDLASESDLIISSPGIKGYKYLFDATMDEYLSYRNGRRSQARVMVGKVIRTDRMSYGRMNPALAP